jgi:hypothetical protein
MQVTAAFGWLRVEIILGLYLLGQAYWVNLLMFFSFFLEEYFQLSSLIHIQAVNG